jgi:outer membrane protein TolC
MRSTHASVHGRHASLVVLALLLTSSLSAFAAESRLSLADAQRMAVDRSRQVVANDAAIAAAREMAVAAGQLPDPVATLGVNNLPVNGPDAGSLTRDFMTMRSVGVMQEWTRAEKRQARSERYLRDADKSAADKAAGIAAIRRDAAMAWLTRYYAEAMLAAVAEQSDQAALELDAAESAYRTGRGTSADILASRGALIGLQDRASELGRRVLAAKFALARWLGDEARVALSAAPAMDRISLDARTFESDLEQHPEIAVLATKEAVAAAEVKLAQANAKADWTVSLMYSQRGPMYSNMVSVNVSVPLQWNARGRQDRETASKLAMLDQARAEREDVLRAHVAEVRAMIAEWENDRERVMRYEQELLPVAAERTEAVIGAYRGSRASLGDVLLARRNEIDLRLQALQLQSDAARLWAQLNFLLPHDDAHRSGDHVSAVAP